MCIKLYSRTERRGLLRPIYEYKEITSANVGDTVYLRAFDNADRTGDVWWTLGEKRAEIAPEGIPTQGVYTEWVVPEVATYAQKDALDHLPPKANAIRIKYIDSDYSDEWVTDFSVNSYYYPTISGLSAIRCNADGDVDPDVENNNYFKINIGKVDYAPCGTVTASSTDSNNWYEIHVKYASQLGDIGYASSDGESHETTNSVFVFGNGNIDTRYAYTISVSIIDAYGEESPNIMLTVPGSAVTANAKDGGRGIAIGKYFTAEKDDYVDIAWDVNMDKDLSVGGNSSVAGAMSVGTQLNVGGKPIYPSDDYVIERGGVLYGEFKYNSDGKHYWSMYEKWNSGVLKNWYWFEVEDVNFPTSFGGGMVRSGKLADATTNAYEWESEFAGSSPTELLAVGFPSVSVTFNTTNGVPAWTWIISSEDEAGTGMSIRYKYIPSIYLIRPSDTLCNGFIEFSAVGRWKTV